MKKSTKSWDTYGSDAALEDLCWQLKRFLTQNKTEREVVRSAVSQLRAAGARSVEECPSAAPGDVVYMNWKNRAFAAAKIFISSSSDIVVVLPPSYSRSIISFIF